MKTPVKTRKPSTSQNGANSRPGSAEFNLQVSEKEELHRKMPELMARPSFNAARLVYAFNGKHEGLGLTELTEELQKQAAKVIHGDLSRPEAILIGQAHALNAMFVNLAERAQMQTGLPQIQCLMGLALKSQAQCRSTLEALAEIKAPRPTTFVRQQNVAMQQQINNDSNQEVRNQGAPEHSRAEHPENIANELLEDNEDASKSYRLDSRKKSATGRPDPELAAMATVHGPA